MKEAFWGVLIVTLGLFGIVVVNLFQNITVDNDRIYYVIKESTEGAAFDAIDLAHYRLNGTLRIVEDKFVENLTRRFAENISKSNYKIVVEDVNEMPPKVSLRVETGVGILNTGLFQREDPFNIVNRVDAIIETKYTKEEIESAGIIINEPEEPIIGAACTPTIGDVDDECIDGDIMYIGNEEINISNKVCTGNIPPSNVNKKVNYKVCECGSWVNKSETLTASPRKVESGSEWIYEWTFYKEGKNRVINQVIKEKVLELQCTTGIEIYVPDDIDEKNQKNAENWPYQPPEDGPYDNSRYEICPPGGIKIPLGMKFVAHPNYIPANSVNRNLEWSVVNENVLGLVDRDPGENCDMEKDPCYSTGEITAKKVGTTYIKVETTDVNGKTRRGQTATCKVEVYDGKVDSVGCKNINIQVGAIELVDVTYSPLNAIIKNTYSIADTAVATVDSAGNVTGKAGGTTILTVKETNSGKTGTCTVTVPSPPPPPMSYPDSNYSGGSSTSNGGYWKVTFPDGTYEFAKSYEEAKDKVKNNGLNEISYKSSTSSPEILYSTYSEPNNNKQIEVIYNGNKDKQSTTTVTTNSSGTTTTTIDKNGNTTTTVVPNKPNYVEPDPPTYYPPRQPAGTPSKGGGGCLDGDTKLLTKNGYKSISEINEGDMVLSYNSETKENEYKEVTMIYRHINMKDVLYTMIVNNKTIKATRLHRFFVKTTAGYKYVKVEDLKIGDLLMDSKGNYHPIRKISSKFMLSNYYDIEVKDNHNYYISRDNILVHNAINTKSNR